MQYGPQSAFSDGLHAEKYRAPGENYRECTTRVSHCLSDTEEHFRQLRDIMGNMRYLFGGRIQSAVGSLKATTPYNCFVSGTIADSFTEGEGSIMARATQAAQTMRMGGGIGYDFSPLRPNGALIRKLLSKSSGPVAFMEIFNAICRLTSSAGNRRGAQMGMLRVDHPDIEEFIRAKQNRDKLRGFNLSVAVTDEFMRAVEAGTDFPLRFDGQVYGNINARDLWEMLMRSTYDWAEPGVIFIDRINEMNNLHYCEMIAATNPCGEQPLPPFGACLLGSMNLVKYLNRESPLSPWTFDFERFHLDIAPIIRAMDNVIDKARYPLAEQEREAQAKRRMGIGVTGAANAIEAMGHAYGSAGFCRTLGAILSTLRDAAYRASIALAQEKGPFKEFRPAYLQSEFIQTLPKDIQDEIATHGIRNSHLLSIAPTGTISLTADNVSSGIEPVFEYSTKRHILRDDGPVIETIPDYGVTYLGVKGRLSDDVTVAEHLAVLKTAAKYVDSAVSKTCNVPQNISWDEFKDIYFQAWKAGCKGCTTYRKGGQLEPLLSKPDAPAPDAEACHINPDTGERSCE